MLISKKGKRRFSFSLVEVLIVLAILATATVALSFKINSWLRETVLKKDKDRLEELLHESYRLATLTNQEVTIVIEQKDVLTVRLIVWGQECGVLKQFVEKEQLFSKNTYLVHDRFPLTSAELRVFPDGLFDTKLEEKGVLICSGPQSLEIQLNPCNKTLKQHMKFPDDILEKKE
jgi:type II secretory pathway pseudopilin PulG